MSKMKVRSFANLKLIEFFSITQCPKLSSTSSSDWAIFRRLRSRRSSEHLLRFQGVQGLLVGLFLGQFYFHLLILALKLQRTSITPVLRILSDWCSMRISTDFIFGFMFSSTTWKPQAVRNSVWEKDRFPLSSLTLLLMAWELEVSK